jgi:hypothetical protein
MYGRRTAVGFIAAMLVTGFLVAGTSADAKPKPKPNLGVAGILKVPVQVRAGGHFGVKVMVVNEGTAPAPASQVSVHLSRDAKKSSGDLNVGRTTAGKIEPWGVHTVPATIDLPESARGVYYVIACADAARKVRELRENDNCNASSTTVEVVAPVEGVLTGTLDFYDSGTSTTGPGTETWDRFAQAEITMMISGRGDDIRVVDDGSAYSWVGEYVETIPLPGCTASRREDEEGVADFLTPGESVSALEGRATDPELEVLQLSASMEYDITGLIRACGQDPLPYTDRIEYSTGLGLQRVASTDDTVTYEVVNSWTDGGLPDQWDDIQGTLILQLE